MKKCIPLLPGLFLLLLLSGGTGGAACTSKPKQYRTVKFKQDVPHTAQKTKRTKPSTSTKSFW